MYIKNMDIRGILWNTNLFPIILQIFYLEYAILTITLNMEERNHFEETKMYPLERRWVRYLIIYLWTNDGRYNSTPISSMWGNLPHMLRPLILGANTSFITYLCGRKHTGSILFSGLTWIRNVIGYTVISHT